MLFGSKLLLTGVYVLHASINAWLAAENRVHPKNHSCRLLNFATCVIDLYKSDVMNTGWADWQSVLCIIIPPLKLDKVTSYNNIKT